MVSVYLVLKNKMHDGECDKYFQSIMIIFFITLTRRWQKMFVRDTLFLSSNS